MENKPKKIEIVSDNGETLDISEVSSHLNVAKPKIKNSDSKHEIVIPKVKK